MKNKNLAVLIILLVIGLLFGSLLGELFANSLPFLSIIWEPKADLNILKYDFFIQVKINLASVIGLIIAFWIYKKI